MRAEAKGDAPAARLFLKVKEMKADCHIHMVLDGVWYKSAIAAHKEGPREDLIRKCLSHYRDLGFTYLRDGGDRWGVGAAARDLGEEYGITYRTPIFPIHKRGHYGGFIGRGFSDLKEYETLLQEVRRKRGNFVKVMISGLMDFDHCGAVTEEPLEPEEIREMIHIAHEEGFSVMAHANGARTVQAAAEAKVDSVEHGAYLDEEALCAMKQAGTVWVPTLATIGNLRGTGRFREREVEAILAGAMENVSRFTQMGGIVAPGSDAGAYAVPHGEGGMSEMQLLSEALDDMDILQKGLERIKEKF